jgi:hypothetical protein
MDHAEATRLKATEKYFLGEFSPEEREAYEDHFFSCAECAADVKSTAKLMDNAREFFRKESATQRVSNRESSERSNWFAGLLQMARPAYAMAAVAVLVLVIGYQNFVTIPQLKQGTTDSVQPLTSYSLVTSGSRGGNDLVFNVHPKSPFGLYVDIPTNSKFVSYVAEVQTENGQSRFSVRIPAEQARETVQLLIPASILASGRYNLVIRGSNTADQNGAGEEIARYPFSLQYNQ